MSLDVHGLVTFLRGHLGTEVVVSDLSLTQGPPARVTIWGQTTTMKMGPDAYTLNLTLAGLLDPTVIDSLPRALDAGCNLDACVEESVCNFQEQRTSLRLALIPRPRHVVHELGQLAAECGQ